MKLAWRIADAAYYLALVGTPLLVMVCGSSMAFGGKMESTHVVLTRCATIAALGVATFAISVVVARAASRRIAHGT